MHRVDAPGSVSGLFSDGNPAIGQQATQVRAAWLNDLQENICYFIEQAGIALEQGDETQLKAAFDAMLQDDFDSSLAATGWQKLRSGLILQWGGGTHSNGTGIFSVTFPIAFPTAGLRGWATNAAAAVPTAFHGTSGPSQTTMNVYSSTSSGVAAPSGTAFNWYCLGK